MVAQKAKSSLADKVGRQALAKAHESHKDDETKFSGSRLPAGIEEGIAEVFDCRFDLFKEGDNQGEYYFIARAVVKEPSEHRGKHTQIGPEPVCETPNRTRKTVEDHIAWIYNELRKLGIDTTDIDPDHLETVVAAVAKAGIHTRFRTWKGNPTPQFPDPRVQETWCGVVTDYEETAESDANDASGDTEESESSSPPKKGKATVPSGDDEDGLVTLGEAADGGDDKAALALSGRAKLHNLDPEEYETWVDVANAILNSALIEEKKSSGKKAEEADEEVTPEKGEVYFYKPPGPGKKKPIECEVTAVFEVSKKCNLKSLVDGAMFKGIAWSALKQE